MEQSQPAARCCNGLPWQRRQRKSLGPQRLKNRAGRRPRMDAAGWSAHWIAWLIYMYGASCYNYWATGLLGYLGVQLQGKRSRGDFMNLLVIKLFHNSQFRLVPWLGQQGSDAKTKSGRLIKHMTLDLSKGNDENAWLRFRTQTCTCVWVAVSADIQWLGPKIKIR